MAIGTKNLVRIKMMDFIINVMVVKERNRRIICAMAETALENVFEGKSAE